MREKRDDTAKVSFTIDRDSTSRGEAIFKMALGGKLLYRYPKQGFYRLSYDDLKSLLDEAKSLLNKKEYIQASEKYYKFMEESIKILAERYAPEVCEKAFIYGGWGWWGEPENQHGLNAAYRAVKDALKRREKDLSKTLALAWKSAGELHRKAFHEFELSEEDILENVENIEEFWGRFRDDLRELEKDLVAFYRRREDREIMLYR